MEIKRIGFLINPIAGLGGRAGLKGSDDSKGREDALKHGYEKTACKRAYECLAQIKNMDGYVIFAPPGEMGGDLLEKMGIEYHRIGGERYHTTREDTLCCAEKIRDEGADLLVFCGGDGTARDIYEVVGSEFPVLGVPSGVKMYSACYALNPYQAGQLLKDFIEGKKITFSPREIMDIDEAYLEERSVSPALYGFLKVLDDGIRLQRAKEMYHGEEDETELIARDIVAGMKPDILYIIGPGGTTYYIKKLLGIEGTLRGVDLIKSGELVSKDADEKTIFYQLQKEAAEEIIVTCIGGNGFIFGRGNQQISPRIIKRVSKENIRLVVTKEKLAGLAAKPMLVDTGDKDTDKYLAGYYKICAGNYETIVYRVDAV